MPATNDPFLLADVVREIEVKGAAIRISARQLGDGWFGVWTCCCGRSGVNGVVYHTAELALGMTAEILSLQGCTCRTGQQTHEYSSASRCA
jgi:hypothetical protein